MSYCCWLLLLVWAGGGGHADETIQLGCMNLNHLSKMVEIPLDLANESAWIEVLMGQVCVLELKISVLSLLART
jgi:hypothetical protein